MKYRNEKANAGIIRLGAGCNALEIQKVRQHGVPAAVWAQLVIVHGVYDVLVCAEQLA